MGKIENKLKELNIVIPTPPAPKGNYTSCVTVGGIIHVSGHIPQKENGDLIKGKLGENLSVDEGYQSARTCAINILGTLSKEIGSLDKVKRIIKLVGFVNCTDDFTQQPAVINGASDLFVEVFGSDGVHARSAVGSNTLPLGIATEVECIVQIKE